MDYRQLFIGLLDSLEGHSWIEVFKDYIGGPIPRGDYSYKLVLEHYKIELSEKLWDFYHSLGACKIEWQCDLNEHTSVEKFHPDDSMLSGVIHIRPLERLVEFDKKLEADWWMKNLSEDEKADLYNFRYLDFNDDYTRVGFILEGDLLRDDMLYFITQDSEGFYPVDSTFDEYIKKWDVYKGFQGWQYNHFFQDTEDYRRMEHYLAQLFPG
jgi:hypothetical protein